MMFKALLHEYAQHATSVSGLHLPLAAHWHCRACSERLGAASIGQLHKAGSMEPTTVAVHHCAPGKQTIQLAKIYQVNHRAGASPE